jgi:hypothetical protein
MCVHYAIPNDMESVDLKVLMNVVQRTEGYLLDPQRQPHFVRERTCYICFQYYTDHLYSLCTYSHIRRGQLAADLLST